MGLADAARTINATGYGYISSWALLCAAQHRLFDRLPATADDLIDEYPDPHLVDTWLHVLADAGLVEQHDGMWEMNDDMQRLLVGDDSYADYLGGQILQQLAPRLTLGTTGDNVLGDVLRNPATRTGYEGFFADAAEAEAYQASQYAGSLGPAKAIADALPDPIDRVLDVGGGWGAIARAVARRRGALVDIVDLAVVTAAAPAAGDGVAFIPGSALDPTTWPTDTDGTTYDGAILSYLFSSIPGDRHGDVLDALAERGVRWVAIHDFMLGGGVHAAAWSLQHAVFVPGHISRSVTDVETMLADRGFELTTSQPLVDEMTTLVVAQRS